MVIKQINRLGELANDHWFSRCFVKAFEEYAEREEAFMRELLKTRDPCRMPEPENVLGPRFISVMSFLGNGVLNGN